MSGDAKIKSTRNFFLILFRKAFQLGVNVYVESTLLSTQDTTGDVKTPHSISYRRVIIFTSKIARYDCIFSIRAVAKIPNCRVYLGIFSRREIEQLGSSLGLVYFCFISK